MMASAFNQSQHWLRSTLVHLAVRNQLLSLRRAINQHLIDSLQQADQVHALRPRPSRRQDVVFYRVETLEQRCDFVANVPPEQLESFLNGIHQQAEMLTKQIMHRVFEAILECRDVDLSGIDEPYHMIAHQYLSRVSDAMISEAEKIRAITDEETINENIELAQQEEQHSRNRTFGLNETLFEKHSKYTPFELIDEHVGGMHTAQGGRDYMEDRAMIRHHLDLAQFPVHLMPDLMLLLSLRITHHCLENSATHTNGTTSAMAFINHEYVFTKTVGDSSVFLIHTSDTEGFKCERLTASHNPSSFAESQRLRREGANILKGRGGNVRLGTLRSPALGVSRSYGHYAQYDDWKGLSSYPGLSKRALSQLNNPHILICSDGLTDGLNETVIEHNLNRFGLDVATPERLRSIAQRNNSQDNISVGLFPAVSGVFAAVNDGHGMPNEGHITSQFITENLADWLADLIEHFNDYQPVLTSLLDEYAIPGTPVLTPGTEPFDSNEEAEQGLLGSLPVADAAAELDRPFRRAQSLPAHLWSQPTEKRSDSSSSQLTPPMKC